MEEYRIARSHGPELVFEGVCITTASDDPDNERAPGRWHEISVYRRSAYRPRFEEGEPVQTTDLLSRHEFSYTAFDEPRDDALPQPTDDRGRLERPGG